MSLTVGLLQRWLVHLHVDRAVGYGVFTSGWQLVSAPVTMLVIAAFLSPDEQGFFYTFYSLVALQSTIELGLSIVVLSAASHEWAHLDLDERGRIGGDPVALSRLVSLGRFTFAWYAAAAAICLVGVGVAGHVFLAKQSVAGVPWRGAWWLLAIVTSFQLWTLPVNALLEGCNQVATVQRWRLIQVVTRSLAMWIVLAAGGHLWATVAAAVVALGRDVYLLGIRYRRFFATFLRPPAGPSMAWRRDIWPMQWRLAGSGILGYLLSQLFVPVTFTYDGPAAAGQMGMTLSIVFAIQSVAGMWLQPKVPTFGMMIARRDFVALDALWWRITIICVAVATCASAVAWVAIWAVYRFDIGLAQRLLPPLPSALFLACAGVLAFGYCQTAYLRAHKREPLMVLSIATSALMGVLVWALGRSFGVVGAAWAYLIVYGGVTLPWQTIIWIRARREWHAVKV